MEYYDLGGFGRVVTTASAEAQIWMDRGLAWVYGFHHEEAVACFERALSHDPGCAMAHWGVAYALGPNYNKTWEAFEPAEKIEAVIRVRAATQAAEAAAEGAAPVERALISTLRRRLPDTPDIEDFGPLNDAFADAMRAVLRDFPEDLDIAALAAEALMNRTPWALWDLATGDPAAGADTVEARRILEDAFARDTAAWSHPGLLHMYIHLMEMSPHPELALRHGDRLFGLCPDAGHLQHMGSHIDVLCGDYQTVVARNQRAVEADRRYLAQEGPDNFYTLYRCHNLHFVIFGAMLLGQKTPALAAADELADGLPESALRPMADWVEAFLPMRQHVFIRFGDWEAILAEPLPEDAELYVSTIAVMRYARTVALANTGRIAEAEVERAAFRAVRDAVPESRMLFNNTVRDILGVAEAMLEGELAYHAGRHEEGFAHLREAVARDDALPYDEPWGWMQPARHALGALLLDRGRVEEAEAVYRADLGLDDTLSRPCQHPRNVWSLHGLLECLTRRGESVEARHVRLLFDQAAARAEFPVRASCACRRAAA